jgi:hypothetical protein
MHANLAKMTAKFAGTCNHQDGAVRCSTRIAAGEQIYYSRGTGALCQACGSQVAKARSAFGLAKKADAKARRDAAQDEQRLHAYIRAHDTLPSWWIATRSSEVEAAMWLDVLRPRAALKSAMDVACDCDECKV